jgi:hypothetical protein
MGQKGGSEHCRWPLPASWLGTSASSWAIRPQERGRTRRGRDGQSGHKRAAMGIVDAAGPASRDTGDDRAHSLVH